MKCVIVLNGDKINDYTFLDGDFIIACDGGLNYLLEKGVKPDLILGDFDSLGFIPEGAKVYSCDKDFTDGELAINFAIENCFKEVEIICAGGGREDHFLGNLSLLIKAYKNGIDAKLLTNQSTIFYTEKSISFNAKIGASVSVAPIVDTIISSSKNLKFEYSNLKLEPSKTLGLSNKATANSVQLCVETGGVFIIVNNA